MADNTGPAFPQTNPDDWQNGVGGMSLLQWYAGKALAARAHVLIPVDGQSRRQTVKAIAKTCFDLAEEMIAEGARR